MEKQAIIKGHLAKREESIIILGQELELAKELGLDNQVEILKWDIETCKKHIVRLKKEL